MTLPLNYPVNPDARGNLALCRFSDARAGYWER